MKNNKYVKWLFVIAAAVAAGYETIEDQKKEEEFEDMKKRIEKLESEK